jgi:hypothetical protein
MGPDANLHLDQFFDGVLEYRVFGNQPFLVLCLLDHLLFLLAAVYHIRSHKWGCSTKEAGVLPPPATQERPPPIHPKDQEKQGKKEIDTDFKPRSRGDRDARILWVSRVISDINGFAYPRATLSECPYASTIRDFSELLRGRRKLDACVAGV